jgi:hypothetical protein
LLIRRRAGGQSHLHCVHTRVRSRARRPGNWGSNRAQRLPEPFHLDEVLLNDPAAGLRSRPGHRVRASRALVLCQQRRLRYREGGDSFAPVVAQAIVQIEVCLLGKSDEAVGVEYRALDYVSGGTPQVE